LFLHGRGSWHGRGWRWRFGFLFGTWHIRSSSLCNWRFGRMRGRALDVAR
jgi:hypothetical protein